LKYRAKIKRDDYSALIFDVSNYLNIPIKVEYNDKKDEYVLVSKTVIKNKEPKEKSAEIHKEEVLRV
jgi:hypothetical protein